MDRAGYTRGMDDYKDARFEEEDFSGARFHGVNFSNVKISDAWVVNAEISGRIGNLVDERGRRHRVRRSRTEQAAPGAAAPRADGSGHERATAWKIDRGLRRDHARPGARVVAGEPSSTSRSMGNGRSSKHCAISCSRPTVGSADRCCARRSSSTRSGCRTRRSTRCRRACSIVEHEAEPRRGADSAPRAHGPRRRARQRNQRRRPQPAGGSHRTAVRVSVMNCLHVVFREEWAHDQYANRDLEILERDYGATSNDRR